MTVFASAILHGFGRCRRAFWTGLIGALLAGAAIHAAADGPPTKGMVSSGHPLATEAGLNALKNGGNAIDAAVAIGFTLGVVDTPNSGIGGGCFMLIRLASGQIVAVDGRETAPAAASRDMFVREGKADTRLSQTGPLASGVPGEVAAFEYAVQRFGRKTLRDLILPAAKIAADGFPLSASYGRRLKEVADEMAGFRAARTVFFKDGKPYAKGDLLKQPDLAATYRSLAERGGEWFYQGAFAQAAESWMKDHAGILRASDFAAYRIVLREPVSTTYRGYRVVSFPPPSSGGVHLVQMLNILERFDVAGQDPTTRLHLLAETMKLAFADRSYWLGDPGFTKVPRGLVAREYADSLAERIHLDQTTPVSGHGTPPKWDRDTFEKHTTHFSVADAEGNWVACTATLNTSFGSKVVIPGTGVVLNNQMDDFSVQPGVTNYFGLVGAEANSVAPGKRPLSSMTPTLVFKEDQPVLALGAAGGPRIISGVLQTLVAIIDEGKTPPEALAQPRIHHQWSPDQLVVESALPEATRRALKQRGHTIRVDDALSVLHLVRRAPDSRVFDGAADPRSGGTAAGW